MSPSSTMFVKKVIFLHYEFNMSTMLFRKAEEKDFDEIWADILYAKKYMYMNGRHQWTEEYPSPELIKDISRHREDMSLKVTDM